jgi:copper homeostasis protein
MTTLEICIDDVDGIRIADDEGVDRVELCTGLIEGGTTPSIGTVGLVAHRAGRAGVNVLIRQRPGDFVYDADEAEAMLRDIAAVRRVADAAVVPIGFVIGALEPSGRIDTELTRRLLDACGAASVTFHRAFDQTPDRMRALDTLVELGVTRVLTSGGASSARAGVAELAALVERAGREIVVMAGGGIRPHNVAQIVAATGVPEVHLRPSRPRASAAGGIGTGEYDSGSRLVTSRELTAAMVAALGSAPQLPA